MAHITIWHNPRCSKSREALKLLEERGERPEIVRYLDETPDAATIKKTLAMLGIGPRDLLRTKEEEYAQLGLDREDISDEAMIEAMVSHPKLIERPIVIKDGKAVIGRPPEKVIGLL